MSFDRVAAARHWRNSILSRGGLTVGEVDELEDHLEQAEEELRERVRPDEAFWLAAHRVGTPEAMTREFAVVRPSIGWELRAQWALIGLLASSLCVPVAMAIVVLLAAVVAPVPPLAGVAAVLLLYASPLAFVLTVVVAVIAVRRLGASPTGTERAVRYLAAQARPGLALVVLGVVAIQVGAGLVTGAAYAHATGVLYVPDRIAPLQSGLWYSLVPAVHYATSAFVLVLIVKIQQRLESARYAQA